MAVTQKEALVAIKNWLEDDKNRVFSLAGAFSTGKTKVLKNALAEFERNSKELFFLSPNSRIADHLEEREKGFSDVKSIYSLLYASKTKKPKDGKRFYPVDCDETIDSDDIIIIFDSHLLNDSHLTFETATYGTGYILRDFLKELETQLGTQKLPRIFLTGDHYQLTRSARDESLLRCEIFKQKNIGCIRKDLNLQDPDSRVPRVSKEILHFQSKLTDQIKAKRCVQLPVCQQGSIKTISKDQVTENIYRSLLEWPRRTVYLCAKNENAQQVNRHTREYLPELAPDFGILTEGDIVHVRNPTPDLPSVKNNQAKTNWVGPGAFACVISSDGEIHTKSTPLKGRESQVSVRFAEAVVEMEDSGKTATILYLPDFLMLSKPELTQDHIIALGIWARKWAKARLEARLPGQKEKLVSTKAELVSTKAELDSMDKESIKYQEELQQYKQERQKYGQKDQKYKAELDELICESPYTNAARLRYAYAMTVHHAREYKPLPRVVLEGRSSHDTDNPATDSYFRWLYTATTCTSDELQIIDYPELTPLTKTKWSFDYDQDRMGPITIRPRLYYQKDRTPTDAEREEFPSGLSDKKPRLVALYLTINELIHDTDWHVKEVKATTYKERYSFTNKKEGAVTLDLDYNKGCEVSIGQVQVDDGPQGLSDEIKKLLAATNPIYKDQNIETAVGIFRDHLSRKNWDIVSVDEKEYKVFLIAEHKVGKIKLELNVPSPSNISKKGVISSIKVRKIESDVVASRFKEDFGNG